MVTGWPGKKGWRTRRRSQRRVPLIARHRRCGLRREDVAHQARLFSRHHGCLMCWRRTGKEGSLSESDGQDEDGCVG